MQTFESKLVRYYFFIIIFLEGFGVMTVELSSAKMMAPYFGTTMYVWAAVLAVTLSGLALGYFIGGKLALWRPSIISVTILLFLATIFTFLMPYSIAASSSVTQSVSLRIAPLISASIHLLPPLVFFGMLGPFIIQYGTKSKEYLGKFSGTIFTISTLGAMTATLTLSYWLLPEWGISLTINSICALLFFVTIVSFILIKMLDVSIKASRP